MLGRVCFWSAPKRYSDTSPSLRRPFFFALIAAAAFGTMAYLSFYRADVERLDRHNASDGYQR